MSFLEVLGFQISRFDVRWYVDIKVAIESGGEDLDGDLVAGRCLVFHIGLERASENDIL